MSDKSFSLDDILNEHPPKKGPSSEAGQYKVSEHTFDLERLLGATHRILPVATPPPELVYEESQPPEPHHSEEVTAYPPPAAPRRKHHRRPQEQESQRPSDDALVDTQKFKTLKEDIPSNPQNTRRQLFDTLEEIHSSLPDKAPLSKSELRRLEKAEKKRAKEEAKAMKRLQRQLKEDIFREEDIAAPIEPEDSVYEGEETHETFSDLNLSDDPVEMSLAEILGGNSSKPQPPRGGRSQESPTAQDYLNTFGNMAAPQESPQEDEEFSEEPSLEPLAHSMGYTGLLSPELEAASKLPPRRIPKAIPKNSQDQPPLQFGDYAPSKFNGRRSTARQKAAAAQLPSPERLRSGVPPEPSRRSADTDTGHLSFEGKNVRGISQTGRISGNTEILEHLMRIKKERIARTAAIQAIPRKSIQDLNLNLDGKILPNTSRLPHMDPPDEREKLRALEERRRKKVSEFILESGDPAADPDENESEGADESTEIEDFVDFVDAPSILSDIGQLRGTLIVRLIVLVVMAGASIYLTLAADFSVPVPDLLSRTISPTNYLFVQTILGLLSVFVSYTVIACGISKLLSFKGDCDSISAIAVLSSLLSTMVCIANPDMIRKGVCHVYIATAICSLLFNTIGKLLIVSRTSRNFQYVSGDFERFGMFTMEDEDLAAQFTRGALTDFPCLASMRKSEFITDFLRNSYASDISDRFSRIAAPCICAVSTVAGLLAGFLNVDIGGLDPIYIGISTFAGCIALSSMFAVMLVVNLPLARCARRNAVSGAAALSYQSVDEFADVNSALLDASCLFPPGMINLASIKTFSDTRIDEAIVQAASLTNHAGSILKNMFYDIIVGKTEMLHAVESYIFEDGMGLCGWIDNKRILLGNRELMINHSIDGMPSEEREREYTENGRIAVYLSISGELSAMFVIEMKASLEVQRWIRELERNEITVVLRTVDAVITLERLTDLFVVSPERLKLLPFRLHPAFEESTCYQPRVSASMVCSGRLASFTTLLLSAKRIRRVATLGLTLQGTSMALGLALGIIMTILSSFGQLSGSVTAAYNLAFALVTVMIQSARRV